MTKDRLNGNSYSINRRRFLKATGAGSALTVTGLAGCTGDGGGDGGGDGDGDGGGGGDGDGGGTVTGGDDRPYEGQALTFVTEETSGSFRQFYDQLASDFNAATGAHLQIDYGGAGPGAIARAIELAQAGNPPEVLQLGPGQAARIQQEGQLEPITSAMNGVIENFGEPTEANRVRFDGEDYFLPLWRSVGQFWYNGAVYDEAPDTREKALAQAQAHDGDNGVPGVYIPTGESYCTDLTLFAHLKAGGVQIHEWDGDQMNFVWHQGENRDRAIETLEWLNQMHESSNPNTGADCGPQSQALATESGHAVYYPGTRPKNQSILQEVPFAEDLKLSLNPAPAADYGSNATFSINDGLVTMSGSNNDLAREFMEFVYSGGDSGLDYMLEMYYLVPFHNFPAFPDIVASDEYQQRGQEVIDGTIWTQDDLDTITEQAQQEFYMVTETSPPNPAAGITTGTRWGSEALFRALEQDEDPGTVVDEVGQATQQVLDENFN